MVLKIQAVSLLSLLVCGGLSLGLAGCYLTQAAHGQLSVMNAREPIDEVLAQEFAPLFGPIAPTYAVADDLAPSLSAT